MFTTWLLRLIVWLPIVLAGLIILWLLFLELKRKISPKAAKRGLIAVIVIYFLDIIAKIIYLYFQLKSDQFGQFLLPPKSNYFYQVIWMLSSTYVIALAIGLIFILILLIMRKIFKSTLMDRTDFFVLLLCVFAVGASNILVLIIASFFLMFFFLLGFNFRQKKMDTQIRITLSPFLLITSFIVLILNNFDFYLNFLGLLRLR